MRSNFASVVLMIAAIGVGSAALAAPMSSVGTIKDISAKTLSVTLQDGTVYLFPKGYKLDGFKVGEKVAIEWNLKGKAHDAIEMKAES